MNSQTQLIKLILPALFLTGCVTGGTYRNNSTPTQLDVVATDQAAVEAAKAGQSQVGMSNQTQAGGFNGSAYRGASYSPPPPYEQLQTQASQALDCVAIFCET